MQSASSVSLAQPKKHSRAAVLACVAAIFLIIYSIASSLISFNASVGETNPSTHSKEYVMLLVYIITFMLFTLGCVIGTALKSRIASLLLVAAIIGHLIYNLSMGNGNLAIALDALVIVICAVGSFSLFKSYSDSK